MCYNQTTVVNVVYLVTTENLSNNQPLISNNTTMLAIDHHFQRDSALEIER